MDDMSILLSEDYVHMFSFFNDLQSTFDVIDCSDTL